MTNTVDRSQPCGNEECDKCYPLPRWKISEHRVQHITYTREIKAPTLEEAMRLFETGTVWPSSYDDEYGEIVLQDEAVAEQLPPNEYRCYRELIARLVDKVNARIPARAESTDDADRKDEP